MPPMVVRVATLTRRSTDDAHQPFSIEAQDAKLAAYIQSQDNWQHLLRFTDDMSGATIARPGLQQALAAAKAGHYDLLLVYKVDRLARSIAGLARILDELDGAGIRFCSATEPFDTSTAAGRMLVQMLGVFAEFERRTIIDRVIAGMERKAARGAWVGGSRPFGYTTDPTTGFLVPRNDQAPLVRVIFDLYANKRLGANAIAAWLNQHGYRTRAGRPWGSTAVLTVLRNRAYLGEIYFRGSYHPAPTSRWSTPTCSRPPSSCWPNAAATTANAAPTAPTTCCRGCWSAPAAASTSSAPPPPATATDTATTPASPASATAVAPAQPSGCQLTSSIPPCWRRCWPPTSEPTCSSWRFRPPLPAWTTPAGSTTTSCRWSRRSSGAPRKPSSATYSPSRPAPWPTPTSLPASTPSPPGPPSCNTAKPT
jgi:DNA invertase Pin-like site-specific DNA recombinase